MSKNKRNDELELDEIFNTSRKSKLNLALRRAKKRSLLKTISISAISTILVIAITTYIGNKTTDLRGGTVEMFLNYYYEIAHPNEYRGKTVNYKRTFGGSMTFSTYKIIEGKVVNTGQQDYSYGLIDPGNVQGIESSAILGATHDEDGLNKLAFNELGQREMVFFYPFVQYETVRNDLDLIEDIDKNKHIEIALSLDKSYSLTEINQIIPNNVTLAWYWVDDMNDVEKENSKSYKGHPGKVRSERSAYGIKAYDENGDPIERPEERFITSLTNGRENIKKLKGSNYQIFEFRNEFERVYTNIAGEDQLLTNEDLEIQGVVVTGDVESLKSLQDQGFVRASSLGVIIDNY